MSYCSIQKLVTLVTFALISTSATAADNEIFNQAQFKPVKISTDLIVRDTPFATPDGRPIVAQLVRVHQTSENSVEITPVRRSEYRTEPRKDVVTWGHAGPVASVRLSDPMVFSASFGWVFGAIKSENLGTDESTATRTGILVEGELGIAGIKGSVGLIHEQIGAFLLNKGIDVKGSLMWTWSGNADYSVTSRFDGGRAYSGVEVDMYFNLIKFSIGAFKAMDGDDFIQGEDDEWLFSFGIGAGI